MNAPAHQLSARLRPSVYLVSLARAFLTAPEDTHEEDVLRRLFTERARREAIDGDALLEDCSRRLVTEGAI